MGRGGGKGAGLALGLVCDLACDLACDLVARLEVSDVEIEQLDVLVALVGSLARSRQPRGRAILEVREPYAHTAASSPVRARRRARRVGRAVGRGAAARLAVVAATGLVVTV